MMWRGDENEVFSRTVIFNSQVTVSEGHCPRWSICTARIQYCSSCYEYKNTRVLFRIRNQLLTLTIQILSSTLMAITTVPFTNVKPGLHLNSFTSISKKSINTHHSELSPLCSFENVHFCLLSGKYLVYGTVKSPFAGIASVLISYWDISSGSKDERERGWAQCVCWLMLTYRNRNIRVGPFLDTWALLFRCSGIDYDRMGRRSQKRSKLARAIDSGKVEKQIEFATNAVKLAQDEERKVICTLLQRELCLLN